LSPGIDEDRQRDIETVKKERDEMVRIGKSLIPLLMKEYNQNELEEKALIHRWSQIQGGLLELCGHLGTIAGFCDQSTQSRIKQLRKQLELFGVWLMDETGLKIVLLEIVGIDVDFTKRQFKMVHVDIEAMIRALQGRLSLYFQR